MKFQRNPIALSLLLGLSCAAASAASPIPVGTGNNTASLFFDFSGGTVFEYEVGFTASTVSGNQLLTIVEDATQADAALDDVVITRFPFSFGDFVTGITVGGVSAGDTDIDASDSDTIDFGVTPAYWIKDPGDLYFEQSGTGFDSRNVTNGAADAWVFKGSTDVVPEPTTATAMLALGGMALLRRRQA